MSRDRIPAALAQAEAVELSLQAAKAFQPRSPISAREFFAGRGEQLTTVNDAVAQTGLHVVLFGERGVGKTSLANIIEPLLYVMEKSVAGHDAQPRLVVKVNTNNSDQFDDVWHRAFDEITWEDESATVGFKARPQVQRVTLTQAFGIPKVPGIDDVRRVLSALRRSVFIFDEFDRGSDTMKRSFTDLIKALSDYAIDSTVVVVGVAETVDQLVRDHASIVRAIVQIQLPRMTERELRDILEKASNVLTIEFANDASSLIVRMSQGLPHYTHLIGLHATRQAANRLSRRVEVQDVHASFSQAMQQAIQSIRDKYLQAIHSAHKDALYERVLLACAIASSTVKDALGYFHPSDVLDPLGVVLDRENVTIATFQKHITDFCESSRGPILERSGVSRAYKYRFLDPLLPPFIFMTAMSAGVIDPRVLESYATR